MSKLEAALGHAARGFRVFPLVPNAKRPAIKGWQEAATTDPAIVRSWWEDNPDFNIGIATGDGLIVFDADCKDGAKGLESLEFLTMQGLPDETETYTVTTPSGGKHVYLRIDKETVDITVSANGLASYPGIDIRCTGGLVAATGSTVDGREYQESGHSLAPCPDFALDIARRTSKQVPVPADRSGPPLVDLDRSNNIGRAIEYLRQSAPIAAEGAGGDHATYAVAAKVRSFGISEGLALTLMLDHWNEEKASPPWSPDDLAEKVRNAFTYAQDPHGLSAPQADFAGLAVEDDGGSAGEPSSRKRPRAQLFSLLQSADRAFDQDISHRIKNMMQDNSLVMLYGPTSVGKSFVALDVSYHVSIGAPWMGLETRKGAILYIAAEGGGGIHKRIAAIVKHYDAKDAGSQMFVLGGAVDFMHDKTAAKQIETHAADIKARTGNDLALIVVDTLSRSIAGGDENSSTDMGKVVDSFDRIREQTGASILVVHHSGKDQARGARGHSLMAAAVDTEIHLADGAIRVTKQREVDIIAPIRFRLKQIDLGKTRGGSAINSCVIERLDASDFDRMDLTDREEEVFGVLEDCRKQKAKAKGDADNWENVSVSAGEWWAFYDGVSRAKNGVKNSVDSGRIGRSFFHKIIHSLVEKGWTKKDHRKQYVS